MFSKLARRAVKAAPLVRTRLQARWVPTVSVRWCSAQVPDTTENSMAVKNIRQLAAQAGMVDEMMEGKEMPKVDENVQEKLSALSLAEQERYCNSVKELIGSEDLPDALVDIMHSVTIEARKKCKVSPPPTFQSLIERHVAQLQTGGLKSLALDNAVWMVQLQAAEVGWLSYEDQRKYWDEMMQRHPDLYQVMQEAMGVWEERVTLMETASKLADRLLPPKQDLLDVIDYRQYVEDCKILINDGIIKDSNFGSKSPLEWSEVMTPSQLQKLEEADQKARSMAEAEIQKLKESLGSLLTEEEKSKMDIVLMAAEIQHVQKQPASLQESFWNIVSSNSELSAKVDDCKALIANRGDMLEEVYKKSVQMKANFQVAIKELEKVIPADLMVLSGHQNMVGRIERWTKLNEIYFGKERDRENFPDEHFHYSNRIPLRYRMIPSTWFDAMYEKTGVTGPHFMLYSTLLFMISKQYLNVSLEVPYVAVVVLGLVFSVLQYTSIHDRIKTTRLRVNEDYVDYNFTRAKAEDLRTRRALIAEFTEKLKQGGDSHIYQALKENVDLQLEADYRQRLANVHTAVKKRLDYQVALNVARQNYEMKHMIDWIIGNVEKAITPQLEKDIMAKCFADLKTMSKQQASV